jgi:Styrene monooxygenase A putative substrate binding domain
MRNITIVGAGQSGLQLGLGLLQNGYRVRLISNRTAEDFATGKVMSSQFMFNDSLQAERDLGINFWEKDCPNTDGLGVTIAGPDGGKAVTWVYTLDKPGQAVDQRVKYPGWMKTFTERGGELVIHEAGVADLENYARGSDLVILAGGKGDIVKLFERDAERSPFDKPQRALALTYVTGLAPYAPTRVAFNIAPTVGEYFVFPALTTTGPCEIMVLEGIPGGPMDCWDDVKTPDQHLERSLDILKKFYPWEYERSRNAKLTDPNGILAGRFPPTVRKPVAKLPSGALIFGMADAVVLNDPITGQGSNSAAKAARLYLKRILDNDNRPFDAAWMQQTFDEYWAYAQFVTGWTNAMLQPPPPHVINILVAAQSKPKVGKAFANGFDDPRTFFPWLADPNEAEKFIAAA